MLFKLMTLCETMWSRYLESMAPKGVEEEEPVDESIDRKIRAYSDADNQMCVHIVGLWAVGCGLWAVRVFFLIWVCVRQHVSCSAAAPFSIWPPFCIVHETTHGCSSCVHYVTAFLILWLFRAPILIAWYQICILQKEILTIPSA